MAASTREKYQNHLHNHILPGLDDGAADLVESLERWRKLHPANGVREADAQPQNYQAPKQWVEAARD